MKHTFIHRFTVASLFILALSVFGTSAVFGAYDVYITLKGSHGKSYKAIISPNGKFTFKDVEPGTYKLLLVGSPEYFTAAEKAHKDAIEVISFQYGSALTQTSGSGSTAPTPGHRVADADVTGDQRIMQPKKVTLANPTKDGLTYYKIILEDITISSVCSPSGTSKGIAIDEPGVQKN